MDGWEVGEVSGAPSYRTCSPCPLGAPAGKQSRRRLKDHLGPRARVLGAPELNKRTHFRPSGPPRSPSPHALKGSGAEGCGRPTQRTPVISHTLVQSPSPPEQAGQGLASEEQRAKGLGGRRHDHIISCDNGEGILDAVKVSISLAIR